MQVGSIPALCAILMAVFLVGVQPAGAVGDAFSKSGLENDVRPIVPRLDGPSQDQSSSRIARIYHRILRATAALADLAHSGLDAIPDLKVTFELHPDTPPPRADAPRDSNAWRLTVESAEERGNRFRMIVDMSEDEAPHLKPVRQNRHMPTRDKLWLSVGAGYKYSESLSVDIGYTRLFLNESYSGENLKTMDALFGKYGTEMDLIGANLRWHFD